jgi:hypothetical protein
MVFHQNLLILKLRFLAGHALRQVCRFKPKSVLDAKR